MVELQWLPILTGDADTDAPPLAMAGAVRPRGAGGPQLGAAAAMELPAGARPSTGAPGDGVLPLTVRILRPPVEGSPDGFTVLTDLEDPTRLIGSRSFGKHWLDQHNEPGSGGIKLHNVDGDALLIQLNDVVQYLLYGQVAYATLVQNAQSTLMHPDEEVELVTTLDGPGVDAMLEWAVVFPAMGTNRTPIETERVFNWTAPLGTYDDSGWGTAASIMSVDAAKFTGGQGWVLQPTGEGFPDNTGAAMIWAPPGSATDAPEGDCYFRQHFTTSAGRHVIYLIIDNYGEVYIDGQLIVTVNEADGFQNVTFQPFELSGGTHTLAVFAHNSADTGAPGNNPGAAAWAIYDADQANTPLDVVAVSNSSVLGVFYPPYPPGMTPGEALLVALGEAHDRGTIPWVQPTFDGDLDSGGNPWPEVADLATKTGNDVLTFARELSGTYIDYRVRPGDFALDAWVKGYRGSARDVPLIPAPAGNPRLGNLTALVVRRQ